MEHFRIKGKLSFEILDWLLVFVMTVFLMAGIGGYSWGWGCFIGFTSYFILSQTINITLYLKEKKEIKMKEMFPLKMLGEKIE